MARINAVSFHEDPSTESICWRVRAAGFDSLEVSRPPFFTTLTTRASRQRFADWIANLGLSLYGFDCWVEVEPYDKFVETLQGFQVAVEFAEDLDLGMIISHDPWARVNGGSSPAECLKINVELFRRVADMCAAKNLRLVFEPHPDTLSMDSSWAIEFIDRISAGHVPGQIGILYDCCHYGVGRPDDYLAEVKTLGRRITHVHFSDGDRKTYALHLPLGEGELDLHAIIEALREVGFNGTLTNDLYNYPRLDEGARRNAPRVREVERLLGLAS
jgi:sugar phosphate isomerase/epimerase